VITIDMVMLAVSLLSVLAVAISIYANTPRRR